MSPMLFNGQVRFGAAVGQASATTPSSGWQKVEVDDLRKSGQFCRKLMRDHVVIETCFSPSLENASIEERMCICTGEIM